MHYANINQGVALAPAVTRSNAQIAGTLKLGKPTNKVTKLHQRDAPLRACHGFTAWFAQLLVDFDGRRAVTGGIRQ